MDISVDVLGFIGLGVMIAGKSIADGIRQGRFEQKLTDLCDHVAKQNGRVGKLEDAAEDCTKENEHRMTKVEAVQGNVLQRLDKIEAIPYVAKRVEDDKGG